MRTFQKVTTHPVDKADCSCPNVPLRFEGYTAADTLWLPEELVVALNERSENGYETHYSFFATPRTVYSFLAEFEPDLALTLLHHGFKTVDDALEFLDWSGHGWITNNDNRRTVKVACRDGITVDDYLDVVYARNWRKVNDDLVMDAVCFLRDCRSTRTVSAMAVMIASGEISSRDVDAVGLDLVSECPDSEHLQNAFKDLHAVRGGDWDGPGYTPEDLRLLLLKGESRQGMIRRLKVLRLFDMETAMSVQHTGFIANLLPGTSFGITAKQVLYGDRLFGEMENGEGAVRQNILNREVIKKLCDAGVDPVAAAPLLLQKETIDRVIAMSHGVHTSMTDGWL